MQKFYRELQIEYDRKRQKAFDDLEKRKKELYEKEPKIKSIEEQLNSLGIEQTRSVIFINDDAERTRVIKDIQAKSERLKARKKEIIESLNLPEDYLKPHFACDKCDDTGFIGTIEGSKPCSCFRQSVINYAYKTSEMYNLDKENFDTFNSDLYSDTANKDKYGTEKSPRENILNIRKKAEEFVENITNSKTKNLMFVGGTGLGKTFMSNAIAKVVLDNGMTVLYQTSVNLMDKIMNYRMGKDSEKIDINAYQELFDVDLLIIDDLGTESMNEMRRSELFNLLNTRILNSSKKTTKTIISTNKDLKELMNYYDQRIVSRLLGYFDILKFYGEDIRLKH